MDQFLNFIRQSVEHAPFLGVLVGMLGALVSLLSGFAAEVLKRRKKSPGVFFANERTDLISSPAEPEVDYEFDTRLTEARSRLLQQEGSAKWRRISMHSLTFCNYVIGGALASSFVQSSISKEYVGLLGVIVLVASLIQQRFRPDVQYRNARERASLLRRLIRKAEDDIYGIKTSLPGAKTVHAIRESLSEGLDKLDALELADVTPGSGHS